MSKNEQPPGLGLRGVSLTSGLYYFTIRPADGIVQCNALPKTRRRPLSFFIIKRKVVLILICLHLNKHPGSWIISMSGLGCKMSGVALIQQFFKTFLVFREYSRVCTSAMTNAWRERTACESQFFPPILWPQRSISVRQAWQQMPSALSRLYPHPAKYPIAV